MSIGKIIVLLVIIALISAFFFFDGQQYLNFEYIKSQQQTLADYYHANTVQTIAIYFTAYVLVTALSLPGAAIMTLVGGAIFGLLAGVVIISFASTIGATCAFIASRFLLRDVIQNKFSDKLSAINQGVEKEGAFYLFTLRLVPAFPFFVINLVMGLTPIRLWTYYWVSQIGMLAGTIVYVYAGTELGKLDSLSGILSPGLITAFVLLGLFPIVTKKIIDRVKTKRDANTQGSQHVS